MSRAHASYDSSFLPACDLVIPLLLTVEKENKMFDNTVNKHGTERGKMALTEKVKETLFRGSQVLREGVYRASGYTIKLVDHTKSEYKVWVLKKKINAAHLSNGQHLWKLYKNDKIPEEVINLFIESFKKIEQLRIKLDNKN